MCSRSSVVNDVA